MRDECKLVIFSATSTWMLFLRPPIVILALILRRRKSKSPMYSNRLSISALRGAQQPWEYFEHSKTAEPKPGREPSGFIRFWPPLSFTICLQTSAVFVLPANNDQFKGDCCFHTTNPLPQPFHLNNSITKSGRG